jgi:hypothetical protein
MTDARRIPLDKLDSYHDLEKRVADLERSLAHQMKLTEQQRRRADLAEASCHRAWKIAAIGGRVPTPAPQ